MAHFKFVGSLATIAFLLGCGSGDDATSPDLAVMVTGGVVSGTTSEYDESVTPPVANRDYADVDHPLADLMTAYWVNFAKTGDPNGQGLPQWPPYTTETDITMVFGDKVEAQRSVQKKQLELFDRFKEARRKTMTN